MNKVEQKYVICDNTYGNQVVTTKDTREAARAVFRMLGGAAMGYTLKQITTVTVEQKIR